MSSISAPWHDVTLIVCEGISLGAVKSETLNSWTTSSASHRMTKDRKPSPTITFAQGERGHKVVAEIVQVKLSLSDRGHGLGCYSEPQLQRQNHTRGLITHTKAPAERTWKHVLVRHTLPSYRKG